MIVFAMGVLSELEDHGTQPPSAPANPAKLLRVVVLFVDQVGLVENLPSLFKTDTVFSPDFRILPWFKEAPRI